MTSSLSQKKVYQKTVMLKAHMTLKQMVATLPVCLLVKRLKS